MRSWRLASTLAVAACFAVGCGSEPEPAQTAGGTGTPETSETSHWKATLEPVTYEGWQEELHSLRGQIVVVDMWATWCLPCVERFPHMVELATEYADQGVEFVSLCLDDRDDADAIELAREFLTEQKATFPNYLMDEVVTQAFEKLDLLGIPAVFIYGPDGALRYRLTGDDPNNQYTDADVDDAIEELLAAG
jgi:cytochrome c biogenesis protein CcmG/thiol:disulfide interchange protein DsbE